MSDLVKAVQASAAAELAAASTAAALDQWKGAYLGAKGKIKALLAQVKDVPAAERPMFGAAVNTLLKEMEEQYASRRESLGLGAEVVAVSGPMVDVTEPGVLETRGLGRQHILMRVREELVEVFARMGFAVAEGPELEDDEHNFIKLNIPPGHPAREEIDNFYVDDPHRVSTPRMMRSQTSTVQIRVMEEAVKRDGGKLKTPIKIVAPGRVYRPDTVDATHSFMFHQIEGLCIDRDVTMVELKSTLLHFARAYFGEEAEVRLRPTFFPFTEPSAELDLRIRLRPDQPLRWMEVGGCGMVHPRVLEACGIDPEEWTGYAFGFGIERLTMGKYAIPDIRMLFTNDLRFLRQV